MFYVYLHFHHDTGYPVCFYVGKGKQGSSKRAWVGANRNPLWRRIVAKHGYTVVVHKDGLTELEAFDLEKALIKSIGRRDLGTGPLANMTDGGDGMAGIKVSDESKAKRVASRAGYTHSAATRSKISAANAVRVMSAGLKAKLLAAHLGKPMSAEQKAKISAGGRGKKRSPETRARMAEAARNRTPEHREKLLLARRARMH